MTATLFTTWIASNLQVRWHIPQPMQELAQTLVTAGPLSLLEQLTNTFLE